MFPLESSASVFPLEVQSPALPLQEQSSPLPSNSYATKIRLTLDINNNPYAKPADLYVSAGFINLYYIS